MRYEVWFIGLLVLAGVFFMWLWLRHEVRCLRRRLGSDACQTEALISLAAAMRPRLPLPQMRNWAISPDLAAALFFEIVTRRPRLVVELGSGVSTLVIGYALERVGEGGRLVSLDHDRDYAERTRRRVASHGLGAFCEVRTAPLMPTELEGVVHSYYAPSALADLRGIDLLFVDGPPQAHQRRPETRYPALPILVDALRAGALIVLDDAARKDERAVISRWKLRWPNLVVEEVPTEKGLCLIEWYP